MSTILKGIGGIVAFNAVVGLVFWGFLVLADQFDGSTADISRHDYVQHEEPSAVCEDGTYSYSTHDQDTCSWHGGVDTWLE